MALDLFPGYSSQFVTSSLGASIFVRISPNKGLKPPLLLLHGFPQTHEEFHKIAPCLVSHFTLVLLDLRGYGASSCVESFNGSSYSKRIMAQDCVSVMQTLNYERFSVLGHDRGARVAYRMAFDVPERLAKIVVVDIIPTDSMFRGFGNFESGLRAYHWLFLAQPSPFPENLIKAAGNGNLFLEQTLSTWTKTNDLKCFDAVAIEKYRQAYCKEERIHSTCEDYRAAAFIDRVLDERDRDLDRKIDVPVLAVWGDKGLFAEAMKSRTESPLEVWQRYAKHVQGVALDCGHFIPEEEPERMMGVVLPFLLS